MTVQTLQNDSLTLGVLPTKKFKAGLLSISIPVPISEEETPLSTLLLSVLRRGTCRYPTLEAINRRLDYLYGTDLAIRNFYRGDTQIIGVCAEILDQAYLPSGEDLLPEILEVVEQMLFHPLLDENGELLSRYVESEKQLQCEAIRSLANDPATYSAERCRELLYEGLPAGVPVYGSIEQIMAVTPRRLTEHWKKLMAAITPVCFYVGSMPGERVFESLQTTFGRSLPIPTLKRQSCNALPLPPGREVRRVDEDFESGQSHLLMAFRSDVTVDSPLFYAAMVYNELLGASPVSRLFTHVRERLSLCYSCSSVYRPYKGILRIRCGLFRDNREVAEREILCQMQALATGAFDAVELDTAKNALLHAYRQLEDSAGALEGFYCDRTLVGKQESVEDCRRAILAVTREDVIAVANSFEPQVTYFLRGVLDEEDEGNEDD